MKILINLDQLSKSDHKLIQSQSITFENYKEAFDFMVEMHNYNNNFLSTYVQVRFKETE